MKAILCTRYGPPEALQLQEVAKPVPGEGEIQVKVLASSVNILDLQMKGGAARLWGGLRKPKDPRLGVDIAGRVEAVGNSGGKSGDFQPGDEVFGGGKGAFAEYAIARQNRLALKPAHVSFEQAVTIPVAAITALQGLRDKGQIQPGQKVLIQGASGGVGTFAVQIAKCFGAEVTAVCSPRNLEQARAMGADYVIDYTREDFTHSGVCYDLIFAANGYHSLSDYRRALNPQGIYLCAGGAMPQIFQALLLGPWMSRNGEKKMGFMGIADIKQDDLIYLGELLEAGKIVPVIDRRYPLADTGKALQYLGEGHARGKVVINVETNNDTRVHL
jgi:NADPH:quinone reductase-like Zn-dependent oxidoreductase